MGLHVRSLLLPLVCCALFLALMLAPGRDPMPSVSAQVSCPPGQTPLEIASLSDVLLTSGAPPMARMTLSRITLGPGESLDVTPAGFTAYYVEAGILKFAFQPGFGISWAPACTSPNGQYSGGGSMHLDAEGLASVTQGEALVSEDVPTGPLQNGGGSPLVMLQMTLVLPQIDPVTGLPMVDPATAGRLAARERERQRDACKAGATSLAGGEAISTPAVSTAGWEGDGRAHEPRIPKACRELPKAE
jgi:hypothetical protein